MNRVKDTRPRQSGMALLISLILLVSLTLLVLSSMRTGRTELSIAGNLRESDIAFNSAEAGLSEAERIIAVESGSKNYFNDSDSGLLSVDDNDPDYLDSSTWENLQPASTSVSNVAQQDGRVAAAVLEHG